MITVTIAGRLGKDAELRQTNNTQVCGFSVAADTGFGDWANALYGDNYEKSFGADAGLVCVCKYTEQIDESLGLIYPGCYAVFEAEGPLNVMFNFDDPGWTEVYIEDAAGNEWSTLPSEEVDDSEFYTEDL